MGTALTSVTSPICFHSLTRFTTPPMDTVSMTWISMRACSLLWRKTWTQWSRQIWSMARVPHVPRVPRVPEAQGLKTSHPPAARLSWLMDIRALITSWIVHQNLNRLSALIMTLIWSLRTHTTFPMKAPSSQWRTNIEIFIAYSKILTNNMALSLEPN